MKVKVNLSNQTLEYMDTQPYIQGTDTRNKLSVYIEHSTIPQTEGAFNIMIAYALQNGRTTIKMANTGAIQETIDDVLYDVFYFTAPSVLTSVAGNFVATIILKVNTNLYKVNVLNTVLNSVEFEAFEDALDDVSSEFIETIEGMSEDITYLQSQVVSVLHNADIVDNDTSNDPTKVLSARMGKVLAERIGATTSGLVSATYNESTGVLTLTYENDDTYEMKIGLDATDKSNMADDVENTILADLFETFSTVKSYSAGDFVNYENNIYEFVSDKSSGDWDSTKVVVANLNDYMDEVNTDLSTYKTQVNAKLDAQDNLIATISQPKYYSTSSLPTTDVGLVVGSDGYIYSWDGTQYVTTGIVYQATQIADGSVTNVKLQDISCLKRFGTLASDVPTNDNSFLSKNGIFVITDGSTRYNNGELPTWKNGILINYVAASYRIQYYIASDGTQFARGSSGTSWTSPIPSNSITAGQIVNNNVLKKGATVSSTTLLTDSSITNTSCMFPISDATTRYANEELPTNKNGLLINYTGDGWWTQFYITHDGEIYTRGRYAQSWKNYNKVNGSNIIDGTISASKLAFSLNTYDLDMAKALVRAEKRNPFEFKTFDTPKIIFMVDDMYADFDKIASIFEEFDIPLSVSCMPSNLSIVCNGLSEDTGSYTVGMTCKQVCETIVSLGGEILAHNGSNIVTESNQYDYNFMYDYFITTKETLRNNGFEINGLIKAGGTGSINATPEIEKWLIGNYDYSDMGTAINYNKQRFGMEYYSLSDLISHIDYAINNNDWIVVYTHRLSTIGETYLRDLLTYVSNANIEPTTYKELFDNFSSSKFLNTLE